MGCGRLEFILDSHSHPMAASARSRKASRTPATKRLQDEKDKSNNGRKRETPSSPATQTKQTKKHKGVAVSRGNTLSVANSVTRLPTPLGSRKRKAPNKLTRDTASGALPLGPSVPALGDTVTGCGTHAVRNQPPPHMVTYVSGWSHEAGGVTLPPIVETGAPTSRRRARFRIPSSQ